MAIGVGLKNGEAGVRQSVGGCMEGRGKWRMFFILELGPYVEMTSDGMFYVCADTLLHGLIYNICEVYIDDMPILDPMKITSWLTHQQFFNDVANAMSPLTLKN